MEPQQEDRDPQDQASETSTYRDPEVIQQRDEGLLSRWEADACDILFAKGVSFSSGNSDGIGQAISSDKQVFRLSISHIYIRCLWVKIPFLRQWITQFLAGRQPDATIIASGIVKCGMTKFAVSDHQDLEGYLIIGSTEQELYGTVAEYAAEHLVSEGYIRDYVVYTVSHALS